MPVDPKKKKVVRKGNKVYDPNQVTKAKPKSPVQKYIRDPKNPKKFY